jgi:hypothetical protein
VQQTGSGSPCACSSCRSHSLCSCHSTAAWLLAEFPAAAWAVLASTLLLGEFPAAAASAVVVSRKVLSAGWKLIELTGACSFTAASFRPCKRHREAVFECMQAYSPQHKPYCSQTVPFGLHELCRWWFALTLRHCHTLSSRSGWSAHTASSSPSCDRATAE